MRNQLRITNFFLQNKTKQVEQESSGGLQQSENVNVRLPLRNSKGAFQLNLVLTQECLGFNTHIHCRTARLLLNKATKHTQHKQI